MNRLVVMSIGLSMAAIPALYGLTGNPALSHRVPVRVPAGVVQVPAASVHRDVIITPSHTGSGDDSTANSTRGTSGHGGSDRSGPGDGTGTHRHGGGDGTASPSADNRGTSGHGTSGSGGGTGTSGHGGGSTTDDKGGDSGSSGSGSGGGGGGSGVSGGGG